MENFLRPGLSSRYRILVSHPSRYLKIHAGRSWDLGSSSTDKISIYDDSPAEQYQFPSQYLRRVEACGRQLDHLLRASKVSETRGYFAMAKVQEVIPDPVAPAMYLALIEPGSYLDFVNPVPFNGTDGLVERGLLNVEGRISGRAQSAVRPISPADFNRIIDLGQDTNEFLLPRVDEVGTSTGFQDEQAPFEFGQSRDRVNYIGSRIVRDRIFRRIVLRAYDERCAITGLKLINGGGRAEVSPRTFDRSKRIGPDVINNGIALSGTAHWMFDRGLISLSDDLEILISRQVNDLDSVRAFINTDPSRASARRQFDRPHPRFLQWHREHCFKQ